MIYAFFQEASNNEHGTKRKLNQAIEH